MLALSRINLVGAVNHQTPQVVIKEIAAAHCIDYDEKLAGNFPYHCAMVRKVMTTKVQAIRKPYDQNDWFRIAKFISPSVPPEFWPELDEPGTATNSHSRQALYGLTQALERYMQFKNNPHSFGHVADTDINYGEMSPMNIHVYDACILYRYCLLRKFTLDWRTTVSEMINLINIDMKADLYSIKRRIIKLLNRHDLSKHSLINAWHALHQPLHQPLQNDHSPIIRTSRPSNITRPERQTSFEEAAQVSTASVEQTTDHLTYVSTQLTEPDFTIIRDDKPSMAKDAQSKEQTIPKSKSRGTLRGKSKGKSEETNKIKYIPVIRSLLVNQLELLAPIRVTDEIVLVGETDQVCRVDEIEVEIVKDERPRIEVDGPTIQASEEVIDSQQLMIEIQQLIKFQKDCVLTEELTSDSTNFDGFFARINGTSHESTEEHGKLHEKLLSLDVTDHATAVIKAACKYLLDISNSSNPLNEYYNMLNHDSSMIDYKPLCPRLKDRMNDHNKFINGLNLSHVFNPYLDIALYSYRTLVSLTNYYGLNPSDNHLALYGKMQELAFLNNFHPGIAGLDHRVKIDGLIQSDTMLTYEDIVDLEPWQTVSFGNPVEGYHIITYNELYRMFHQEGYYRHITRDRNNEEMYSSEQIARLLLISGRSFYSGESEDNQTIRRNLASAIRQVRTFASNISNEEKHFMLYYRRMDDKANIIDGLMSGFLDLTMKMRGWDGRSEYPISRTPQTDSQQVDINVNMSLARFDRYCQRYSAEASLFKKLPLYKYNCKRSIFIRSNDIDEGLTVGDRLDILRLGEGTRNMNSCLRMTSNRFLATYYHTMQILGKSVGFTLDDMREIS